MTDRPAIVILGAAVWEDGPSPTLVRRTRHGATLYRDGLADVIIPCGGLGDYPPTEAEAMRQILVSEGLPGAVIHCEDRSTSTYENLRNAVPILRDLGITRIVIVTDSYHRLRALLVARALGLSACSKAPDNTDAPLGLRMRRLTHEAVACPAYALRLPYWLWRDR